MPNNKGFDAWTYGSLGPKTKEYAPVIYKSDFTIDQIREYMCNKV